MSADRQVIQILDPATPLPFGVHRCTVTTLDLDEGTETTAAGTALVDGKGNITVTVD